MNAAAASRWIRAAGSSFPRAPFFPARVNARAFEFGVSSLPALLPSLSVLLASAQDPPKFLLPLREVEVMPEEDLQQTLQRAAAKIPEPAERPAWVEEAVQQRVPP